MNIPYRIIRSSRRTVAIQIMPCGEVVVRCPKRMGSEEIRKFVEKKSAWIEKHCVDYASQTIEKFTPQEIEAMKKQAKKLIAERVQHYASRIGVTYGTITIRTQRTRWGSCSSKGNLSFNCLLALVPPEVLDYVVIHELCHRMEMNHSSRFWITVEGIMPDYQVHRKWLKENGSKLIARI